MRLTVACMTLAVAAIGGGCAEDEPKKPERSDSVRAAAQGKTMPAEQWARRMARICLDNANRAEAVVAKIRRRLA